MINQSEEFGALGVDLLVLPEIAGGRYGLERAHGVVFGGSIFEE